MRPDFPGAVPEIPVTEIAAATAYYRDRLGFGVDWGDDELGLAGVSRGECRIFLASGVFRAGRGNGAPTVTWLNLDSNDAVDALHREWEERGATLLGAPESKPWGLHEFFAADPDGNLFRVFHDFATPERERNA